MILSANGDAADAAVRPAVGSFTICGFAKPSRAAFEARFWAKVERGPGCWTWTAKRLPHGYGQFAVARGAMRLAHRVAWELERGTIPEGLRVLHACDNPSCVRLSHLFLGTAKDNTQDMLRKARHAHGTRHGASRLTESDVLEIRALYAAGVSCPQIGKRFDIAASAAWKIVTRKRWMHV